jgi:Phage protein Gp138 N-terminal domain/GpV Apex motif
MDRRERIADSEETLRMAFESMSARMWSALPGVIQAVTNNGQTVEVQPTINGLVRMPDGSFQFMQLPKLVDVIIQWPQGGGVVQTFPLAVGDECLVVFSSRCIDNWWTNGFQPPSTVDAVNGQPFNPANNPPSLRMNNLSDGFAIPGVRSKPRKLNPPPNPTTAQTRTLDGTCYWELDPINKKINVVASGGANINGAVISGAGEVTDALGKVLGTHVHSGVQTGGSNTGTPA